MLFTLVPAETPLGFRSEINGTAPGEKAAPPKKTAATIRNNTETHRKGRFARDLDMSFAPAFAAALDIESTYRT